MNFKDMLDKLSMLSEATKETEKGRVHKADPGGYGRKYDTDEEGEEKDGDKDAKKPTEKRGRGRPSKTGAHASSPEEKKKQKGREEAGKTLQSMIGKAPKKSKELDKLPKKKHSLKEYFDQIDAKALKEAEQITINPAQQKTQVIKQGTKTLGTIENPTLAAQIKNAIGKGEMSLAGKELGEEKGEKWIQKAVKHPGAFTAKAKAAGKSVAAFAKEKAHAPGTLGKQARLAQTLKKMHEADMPPNDSLSSPLTLEAKKAKPDFPDIDNDGNKKESIAKAAQDAKKKKSVKEGMSHKIKAAFHAGKSHALAKEGYNCRYEDMEEARQYHEGYKVGLDECYGQMPIQGLVGEESPTAVVDDMASYGAHDMDEGNAFGAAVQAAKSDGIQPGETIKLGGRSIPVKENPFDVYEDVQIKDWDSKLTTLVNEGMSVSISKGNQGAPDSVTVTAQDGEADQLLGLIKQAGLGLFGDEQQSHYGSPDMSKSQPGGIEVVDDHDGMMKLMKLVGGGDSGSDYKDEEHSDHQHEESCDVCGESNCGCDEGQEMVDEVETEDQMAYNVAEEEINPNNNDEANEVNSDAVRDAALATAADDNEQQVDEGGDGGEASEEPEEGMAESEEDDEQEKLDEWANQVGDGPGKGTDAAFEQDIEFMTKVISGGLNKPKSTGQTTIPVIANQAGRTGPTNEGVQSDMIYDWKVLAGIR
jgi:hypothetical protein